MESSEQHPKEPGMDLLPRIIGEGIVILLVTAVAYGAAYAYEFLYAFHFHIPSEFITVTIQSLVYCGFSACFFILITSVMVFLVVALIERVSDNEREPTWALFIKKWGTSIVLWMLWLWWSWGPGFTGLQLFFLTCIILQVVADFVIQGPRSFNQKPRTTPKDSG